MAAIVAASTRAGPSPHAARLRPGRAGDLSSPSSAIAIAGVLAVYDRSVRGSADPLVRKQAIAIAESLLNEVLAQPFTYCDPQDPANDPAAPPASTAACTGGAAASEDNGGGRSVRSRPSETRFSATDPFDNVADYNGYAMSARHLQPRQRHDADRRPRRLLGRGHGHAAPALALGPAERRRRTARRRHGDGRQRNDHAHRLPAAAFAERDRMSAASTPLGRARRAWGARLHADRGGDRDRLDRHRRRDGRGLHHASR